MYHHIINAWMLTATLAVVAWIIYLYQKNPGIIDVFWPINIALAALIFSAGNITITKILLQVLLLAWSSRLAIYLIATRIVPKHIETRYKEIGSQWKLPSNIGVLLSFQLQAAMSIIIACPFIFITNNQSITAIQIIAICMAAIGIIGESHSDSQLNKFKKLKTSGVCNTGLWRYSRHPNCFFDILTWSAFAIAAISKTPSSYLALLSPIVLSYLMIKITIPITEKQSIKNRGQLYIDYIKKTSMLIPWPPRRD